jgi:hypothetical protein
MGFTCYTYSLFIQQNYTDITNICGDIGVEGIDVGGDYGV